MAQLQMNEQMGYMPSCRAVLQQTLQGKQKKNSRYSLRAFARDLKVSPSFLSEVLHGKYGISKQLARQISERLGFSADDTEHFCSMADLDITESRSRCRTGNKRSKSSRFCELEIDVKQGEMEAKFEDLRDSIHDLMRQSRSGTFMLHIRS